jgi:hypothetical protein
MVEKRFLSSKERVFSRFGNVSRARNMIFSGGLLSSVLIITDTNHEHEK